MGEVIPIGSGRLFTREAAEEILPTIRRLTAGAAQRDAELAEQLRWVPKDEPLYLRLQSERELVVRRWSLKIERLGCIPRDAWTVDFDAGGGQLSWRCGDETLNAPHPHAPPDEPSACHTP